MDPERITLHFATGDEEYTLTRVNQPPPPPPQFTYPTVTFSPTKVMNIAFTDGKVIRGRGVGNTPISVTNTNGVTRIRYTLPANSIVESGFSGRDIVMPSGGPNLSVSAPITRFIRKDSGSHLVGFFGDSTTSISYLPNVYEGKMDMRNTGASPATIDIYICDTAYESNLIAQMRSVVSAAHPVLYTRIADTSPYVLRIAPAFQNSNLPAGMWDYNYTGTPTQQDIDTARAWLTTVVNATIANGQATGCKTCYWHEVYPHGNQGYITPGDIAHPLVDLLVPEMVALLKTWFTTVGFCSRVNKAWRKPDGTVGLQEPQALVFRESMLNAVSQYDFDTFSYVDSGMYHYPTWRALSEFMPSFKMAVEGASDLHVRYGMPFLRPDDRFNEFQAVTYTDQIWQGQGQCLIMTENFHVRPVGTTGSKPNLNDTYVQDPIRNAVTNGHKIVIRGDWSGGNQAKVREIVESV